MSAIQACMQYQPGSVWRGKSDNGLNSRIDSHYHTYVASLGMQNPYDTRLQVDMRPYVGR